MSFVYTDAKRAFLNGELTAASDLRLILVMTNTTSDTEEDAVTIGDFTTLDEYDGSGYTQNVGVALASVAITKDDANDRAFLDAADVVFSSLGAGARQSQAAIVLKWSATLAGSLPVAYIDQGGFPFNGTGSDVTIQWNTEGIIRLA